VIRECTKTLFSMFYVDKFCKSGLTLLEGYLIIAVFVLWYPLSPGLWIRAPTEVVLMIVLPASEDWARKKRVGR
jgi:hypothetical protein